MFYYHLVTDNYYFREPPCNVMLSYYKLVTQYFSFSYILTSCILFKSFFFSSLTQNLPSSLRLRFKIGRYAGMLTSDDDEHAK